MKSNKMTPMSWLMLLTVIIGLGGVLSLAVSAIR